VRIQSESKKSVGLLRCAHNDAFTLAEVLITLVIIGIIAAITVPTLITKYQKEQTVTRLKKAYSALAQTTQRAIADNGPMDSWEVGATSVESSVAFNNKYLIPYLSVSKNCETDTNGDCNPNYFKSLSGVASAEDNERTRSSFYLNDGTLVSSSTFASDAYKDVHIYVDINGQKKPNIKGKDVFVFVYIIYSRDAANDPTIRIGQIVP